MYTVFRKVINLVHSYERLDREAKPDRIKLRKVWRKDGAYSCGKGSEKKRIVSGRKYTQRGFDGVCAHGGVPAVKRTVQSFRPGHYSRINPESVAAVSFFNQLNNSVTAVGTGLSIGAGILIAGFYGAADYENVKKTVNTTFFLAVGGALLLAISLILSGKWVLRLANTPEELVEIGWNYYRVIMVNLVFVFFNNVYVAIEKARGNGGRILGVNLLMAAAKFTLSGVFVLIFRQGVVMIAFSTLLSNLLVTLIGIYSLRDPKDVFGISLEYIRMDRLFIKKLFGISLPVMAEKFAFSTGKVVVNSVGVDYGTQTVGALGVSNSISALSTVPAGSIGDGGASIIRQNIGSGKRDRA